MTAVEIVIQQMQPRRDRGAFGRATGQLVCRSRDTTDKATPAVMHWCPVPMYIEDDAFHLDVLRRPYEKFGEV